MAFPDGDLQVVVKAYLGADPSDDPGDWPEPVDLSSRLLDRDITITHGRRSGQRTAAAGSATLWLDNSDGALTPLHPSSPYYGLWDLGVPVLIDVDGVGSSPPYPRFRGYVASIEPEILPGVGGHNISVVRVTLGGILRRLGQGGVHRSSARRLFDPAIADRMGRSLPIYYWPVDYGQPLASLQSQPIIGNEPVTLEVPFNEAAPDWAGAELAPWLGSGLRLTGAKTLYGGSIITPATPTTIAADVVYRYERMTGGTSAVIFVRFGGADVLDESTSYGILAMTNPLRLELRRVNSTLTTETGDAAAVPWDGRLHHVRVVATQNGPDVDVAAYIDGELVMSATDPSVTLGMIPRWILSTLNADLVVGHAALWVDAVESVSTAVEAAAGYTGETAGDRIARICAEDGIPHTAWPSPSHDIELGPQPVRTVLDVLRDAETAGQGRLYETLSTWGLGYRPLRAHYDQDPLIAVDLSTYRATGRPAPLRPVRNDARVRNEWTVRRVGGSEVTVIDADHQAKRGRYNDSVTVNLASDDQLTNDASWRLHVSTDDSVRYPSLTLDLGANPDLLASWLDPPGGTVLGARVDVTGLPQQHTPDDLSMLIEGYTETLRRRSWVVELVTEPYLPWHVGVYADSNATANDNPSRYDSAECVTRHGLWLPGTSTDYASTPDSGALSITGDLDIRVYLTASDWTPSTNQTLVAKYNETGNQRSYQFRLNTDGTLTFIWSVTGTSTLSATSTTAPTIGSSGLRAVRVTFDADNDSGGWTVRFYEAASFGDTWTQLGAPITGSGTTSIFDSTADLRVGARSDGLEPFTGIIHAAQVRDGINGTVVANPDFQAHSSGDTTISDSAGNTWTINGGAEIFDTFQPATHTRLLVVTTSGPTWTTNAAAFPMRLRCDGVELTVTGAEGTGIAQVLTISGASVMRSITSGRLISLAQPSFYAL